MKRSSRSTAVRVDTEVGDNISSRQNESPEAGSELRNKDTAVGRSPRPPPPRYLSVLGDEESDGVDQADLTGIMCYDLLRRKEPDLSVGSTPDRPQNEHGCDTTDTSHAGGEDNSDDDYFDPDGSLSASETLEGEWLQANWMDDLDDDSDDELGEGADHAPAKPHYPQGPLTTTECFVCFEEMNLRRRLCCDFPVCDSCLVSYLVVQVSQATVHIECLNSNCQSYIHRDEILSRLPVNMKSKFYKFLIDANLDPTLKTCPRCSNALRVDRTLLRKRKVLKNGLFVRCPKCLLEWCFTCHAPWHKGITCKAFRKGDLLLKDWAHEFHYGQLNAQKCPKCKIYIQRSLGCDHMTCNRCETSFCYRCGEHYRSVKLLGNHFSRLSPFGCRYNFMPDAPHTRRLIRGAVLGGKLIGGLALSGFVVAAGVFLLGVSVVALPVWGGYKLHKRRRYRRQLKRRRKRASDKHPNHAHSLVFRPPEPPVLMPFTIVEHSDSTVEGDDSSDENRDHMRQLVIGLQLPDSQSVEVLVHRTVGSHSDQEEQGAAGGGKEGGGTCEPSIILTDVQEVTNEDGQTTFVTHIYAKQLDDKGHVDASSDGSEDEDESDSDCESQEVIKKGRRSSSQGRLRTSENHLTGPVTANPAGGDANDATSTKKSSQLDSVPPKKDESKSEEREDAKTNQKTTFSMVLTKDCAWKPADGEKAVDGFLQKLRDRRQKEKDKEKEKEKDKEREKEKDREADKEKGKDKETNSEEEKTECSSPDQFVKEGTNGCFGNIFAKKLTALSNNNHTTSEAVLGRQKMPWRNKSATWEKSSEKGSQHKHIRSIDFCDAGQRKDKDQPPIAAGFDVCNCKTGVLLQDCVVLNGNESQDHVGDSDGASLTSSQSLDELKLGEGGSACSVSASEGFRGSTLSCDIVTYL